MSARILTLGLGLCLGLLGEGPSYPAEHQLIPWHESLDQAVSAAHESGRPLLVYIRSANCGFCRKMEWDTWSDSSVATRVTARFVPLKIDGDRNSDLLDRWGIEGFPAVVVLSRTGAMLLRIEGYQSPKRIVRRLDETLRTR